MSKWEREAQAAQKKKEEDAAANAAAELASNGGVEQAPVETSRCFVGNLSWDCDEEGLKGFFESCGPVQKVDWQTDWETGEFKGCGYVQFADLDAATAACELSGEYHGGRPLTVSFAKAKPASKTSEKTRLAKAAKASARRKKQKEKLKAAGETPQVQKKRRTKADDADAPDKKKKKHDRLKAAAEDSASKAEFVKIKGEGDAASSPVKEEETKEEEVKEEEKEQKVKKQKKEKKEKKESEDELPLQTSVYEDAPSSPDSN